jgi:hypothetical protein
MAQPVIDNTYLPQVGDTYTLDMIDSNYILPSAGANQVWDYSNLSFYFNNASYNYLDPANTPYASNFSNANLAENQQGSSDYVY